ncbi:integrase domain-containing protein [Colwellia psychrerythraea]|uniref:Site-specific recombinase, phage integrase family n=1 Tax=Colwellia psychrerythraea (strain 34H / ATCC BAA-681) TaxID=167879 RepID=Q480A2_COLP3|nr:integrase domain-containing protein [Colwellia psychrerythraea]AAZ27231.1 site-specific recombinase, phage integrase family [Colwellia psychrerythraea 34H]
MARKVKPLTNTEVKQAKPKDKIYKLSDGDGLQLRIMPNGSKQWLLDYFKPYTKKRTSFSLGSYPDVTLANARAKRASSRELLAQDIDPKEHKEDHHREQLLIASHTLKSVAEDWFAIKKTTITEVTAKSLWRKFENHVFPKLGHRPIDKILAPEAIEALKPLAAKGNLETTGKIIGHLNNIMTHAVNTGILHHNPLSGIRSAFSAPKVTNMPTIKPNELGKLMKVISYASIKLVTRCLIEWQLHTMTRPSESAKAEWSEIDLENRLWVIPAERMKMRLEHKVPLTKQSIEILERLKPITGHRTHLFPSHINHHKHCNVETANKALIRMGYKNRLVAHGLRALASTTLNEQEFNADVIESALSHVDKNEVRRAYNRAEYLDSRRELMCWWSEHIEQAVSGNLPVSTLKEQKIICNE